MGMRRGIIRAKGKRDGWRDYDISNMKSLKVVDGGYETGAGYNTFY
jgi:hypothetical protein